MTGYGRATHRQDGKTFTVEIRALNSKQSDLRLRSSRHLHRYEVELRKLVQSKAERGKLEMTVTIDEENGTGGVQVDLALLGGLYNRITFGLPAYATEHSIPDSHLQGIVPGLLRIPGIIDAGSEELSKEDWSLLKDTALTCLNHLRDYRVQEGQALFEDLRTSVLAIKSGLEDVANFEQQRVQSVRDRMERHLADYLGKANVDKNRYEQEVLFYLEKMDINEEKVRLAQNCDYFLEIMGNEDVVKGRKLSFISQEIGREINTLGAKAYSPDIQRIVVNMKEQLEMIKEQLANVA